MGSTDVRLIHWNAAEAGALAGRLRSAGFRVNFEVPRGLRFLRDLRAHPPAAVVIVLSRLPSQGRDVAMAIRHSRATRSLPLVFAGGDPAKVSRIRAQIPEAVYTSTGRLPGALKLAIAHPREVTVVPRSSLEGYSGTPLVKKLGIREGSVVALIGAPRGFEASLGVLPEGAILRRRRGGRRDLTIWFARSMKDLEAGIRSLAPAAGGGAIWIAWPKKTSSLVSDLTQTEVRRIGLASGLVDYKVCAIDATWSGLLFTRRRGHKARGA